ncbi:MAG: ACT domain-containing protein [Pirellulaceae bacterium]|jgi:hypothetical protein|nr:ACT domain-containing protein [Pirellulaceae bacterium]
MTVDPNSPERLTAVPSDIQAAAIVNALADRGIQATVTGSYTSGFRAEAPGWVSIVVRRMDLDSAKQALAELQPGSNDADWPESDAGEARAP